MTPKEICDQTEKNAKKTADYHIRQHELAVAPDSSPEHRIARQSVVRTFFQIHLPEKNAAAIDAYLATIDLSRPVKLINASTSSTSDGQTQTLCSDRFPPKSPSDPVYALHSYRLKKES